MSINNVPIIDLRKESLVDAFQKYMGKSFSCDKMISFLSTYSAHLLALITINNLENNFSQEEKENLYQFHDWFSNNYGKKTYKIRMREWGQEPFIFRYTENLYTQDRKKEREDLMKQASPQEIKDAEILRDQLLQIKQDKILYYIDDKHSDAYHMPGTFSKPETRFMKSYFGEICLEALKNKGILAIRILGNKKENDRIFGVHFGDGYFVSIPLETIRTIDHIGAQKDSKKLTYTTLEDILRRG